PAAGEGPTTVHRVAKGETLLEIGQRYGVSMAQIAARNDIRDPADVREGQALAIPVKTAQRTRSADAGGAAGAPAAAPGADAAAPDAQVAPGDPVAAVPAVAHAAQAAADLAPGSAPLGAPPTGEAAPSVAPHAAPADAEPALGAGAPMQAAPAAAQAASPTTPVASPESPEPVTTAAVPSVEPEPAPAAPPPVEPASDAGADAEPAFERVRVEAGDTLGSIAARSGVSAGVLAAVNGIDDPRRLRPGQVLAIPREDTASAPESAPQATTRAPEPEPAAEPPPAEPARVLVEPGDTLGAIARREGVEAAELAAVNAIRDPRSLRPGQVLVVPGRAAPADSPRAHTRTEPPAERPAAPRRVKVARGDTLASIARRSGVDAKALAALNGIRNPRSLRPGQVLELPGGGSREASAAASARTYTVRSGDTLYSIAQRHGVTPGAIADLNGLRDHHKLSVGQQLRLPPEQRSGRSG
ncbi:MAG TPA: LysM peptidoglycan-binding domain-containing protein, partial [Myxococcota bacterium]|nr:LysM peptidoglycan-binding domain-containing protein [Myxococcota bacterium]